jgi:hypothetical protein
MVRWAWLALLGLPSCSTLADSGGGDVGLPNAGAGPFREIESLELGNNRSAPNVLKDDDLYPRHLSVVDADGDLGTLDSWGYAALTLVPEGAEPDPTASSNGIGRYRAPDGRSFERQHELVLEPTLPWEGDEMGAPSALVVGDEIRLYYAAAGGIGLATSSDGLHFERRDEPVLGPAPDGWEQGATPQSPSVVAHPSGGFRLFYEVRSPSGEASLGEAVSADGVLFERRGAGPVLAPRPPGPEPLFDDRSVEAPHGLYHPSAEGRMILWLYYGAVDQSGGRSIAVAARRGDDEPLVRGTAPVFGTASSDDPSEPWVIRYGGFALLFATQRAGSTESQNYPAVAAGVAPATAVLPPPVD